MDRETYYKLWEVNIATKKAWHKGWRWGHVSATIIVNIIWMLVTLLRN